VSSFDEASGLGTITSTDGAEHPFHCIEIADGSRTIDIGAEVSFDLLAKFGRWEAANIRR
jgi:CspA family cold shock protein